MTSVVAGLEEALNSQAELVSGAEGTASKALVELAIETQVRQGLCAQACI